MAKYRDPRQQPAFLELEMQDKKRKRDARLAQEDVSTPRKGLSSQASALIALVAVLVLIVVLVVLYRVFL